VIAEYMQFIIEKLDRKISMTNLIEYMKIHLISLNQDFEEDYSTETKINIQGQIMATEHLLSVAGRIMRS
jgi:hypothetical protein